MNWKSLKVNDNAYMICLMTENESWKILLTNLIDIWMETLTDETIFRKCQTLNPLLTLEAFDWQALVMDMLNDIPKHVRTYVAEACTFRIELQRKKDFIKLRFALDLVNGTPQQFWQNVTMPLCLSSMELIRQHELLLDLVKRKDEEIAEYKAEGAELIRSMHPLRNNAILSLGRVRDIEYIATKAFNEELFHVDAAAPDTTDFVKAFQSVFHFYNAMNLSSSHMRTELKTSSNSGSNNTSVVGESILSESSKSLQTSRQNDEQAHLKIEECEDEAIPSTSKVSIFKLSNTSHKKQKHLKRNKKTLNDFIS